MGLRMLVILEEQWSLDNKKLVIRDILSCLNSPAELYFN